MLNPPTNPVVRGMIHGLLTSYYSYPSLSKNMGRRKHDTGTREYDQFIKGNYDGISQIMII